MQRLHFHATEPYACLGAARFRLLYDVRSKIVMRSSIFVSRSRSLTIGHRKRCHCGRITYWLRGLCEICRQIVECGYRGNDDVCKAVANKAPSISTRCRVTPSHTFDITESVQYWFAHGAHGSNAKTKFGLFSCLVSSLFVCLAFADTSVVYICISYGWHGCFCLFSMCGRKADQRQGHSYLCRVDVTSSAFHFILDVPWRWLCWIRRCSYRSEWAENDRKRWNTP